MNIYVHSFQRKHERPTVWIVTGEDYFDLEDRYGARLETMKEVRKLANSCHTLQCMLDDIESMVQAYQFEETVTISQEIWEVS